MYLSEEALLSILLDPKLISVGIRIMVYILKFVPEDNPLLISSCKKIASYVQCSESSVAKTMKVFEQRELITRVQNGVWHVNYDVIHSRTDKLSPKK